MSLATAVLMLTAAALGGCAGGMGGGTPPVDVVAAPAPGAPVAEVPTRRVGDHWIFRNPNNRDPESRLVTDVVRVETDGTYEVEQASTINSMGVSIVQHGRAIIDRTGQIQKKSGSVVVTGAVLGPSTRQYDSADPKESSASAGQRPVNLPLWQGKRWLATIGWTSEGLFTTVKAQATLSYFVDRHEEIEVPAGRFEAYRIARRVEEGAGNIPRKDPMRYPEFYWYAPAAHTVIRVDNPGMDNETNRDMGIVPYKLWLTEWKLGS